MDDFTLVIPTYNRPRELAALLRYFETHEVDWQVLVLDSGSEPVSVFSPGIRTVRYPSDIDPFDKFRRGLGYVQTEFCALCADDDLYIPSALYECVKVLRENPRATLVTGWSFTYDEHLQLREMTRRNPSIIDVDPLVRLARLFRHYHALTYGVYRTRVLQQVLSEACALPSMLARELLASALTVIKGGEVIYIPRLTHGRSCGPPIQVYDNCHPALWIMENADGLFKEYVEFRTIIIEAVMAVGSEVEGGYDLKRMLDLIFLSYLQQTVCLSYSVEPGEVRVLFKDSPDDGAPEFRLTAEEAEELLSAMRHYKLMP